MADYVTGLEWQSKEEWNGGVFYSVEQEEIRKGEGVPSPFLTGNVWIV